MSNVKTAVAPAKAKAPVKKLGAIEEKKAADKKAAVKKPAVAPAHSVVVSRSEVIPMGRTGETLVNKQKKAAADAITRRIEEAEAKEAKAAELEAAKVVADKAADEVVTPATDTLIVETDDEKFEREYVELEASQNEPPLLIPSATVGKPKRTIIITVDKTENAPKEKKAGRRKKAKDEEAEVIELPVINTKGMVFSEEYFFQIAKMVECLATRPLLRKFIALHINE